MISVLKGKIFDISPGECHLEVADGIVVKIFFPVSFYSGIKKQDVVRFYTVMKIKEDDPLLYGFTSIQERDLFEKLITISGVGGKTALSFISAFSVQELADAINNGDTVKISSIPGIGKKTAQRVILELTGKLDILDESDEGTAQLKDDAMSGLINLGYSEKLAKQAVNAVMKDDPDIQSFEDLFKKVLKKISR